VNRIRLRKVAYFLPFMSEKTLDFRAWAYSPIGWACRQPEIERLGLTLETGRDGTLQPHFEGEHGWPAVERFFDLTPEEALGIFDANAYWDLPRDPVPEDVAQKIREAIAAENARRVDV